jgi:succinylglutamate desuccinylase
VADNTYESREEMAEGRSEQKKKKVMVAIDESECSRYALLWALDNLHETIANSELILFAVQPIVDLSYAMVSTLGAARMFLSLY